MIATSELIEDKKEKDAIKKAIKILKKHMGKPCKEYGPLCFNCENQRTVAYLEMWLSL